MVLFFLIEFEPVGKCLYVYGGGWNEPDTGAGPEALKKGVSESWTAFYDSNSSAYDYTKTRYRIHDGLDCTGYVGWCMYQLFENAYAENGYVFPANEMARQYAAIFNGDVLTTPPMCRYAPFPSSSAVLSAGIP